MPKRLTKRTFANLAWADLEEWAGTAVVGRGRGYKSEVEDLRVTADGRLLAWVQGSRRYATRVTLGANGRLASTCSCPYAVSCKHAVATILVYLDALKAGQTVPVAEASDARLARLAGNAERAADEDWEADDDAAEWDDDAGDEDDDDEDENDNDDENDDEDDDENDDEDGDEGKKGGRGTRLAADATKPARTRRRAAGGFKRQLRDYLNSLTREQLTEMLVQAVARDGDLREELADQMRLKTGKTAELAKACRREIDAVTSEEAWTSHWSDEGNLPDYSRVEKRLRALLAAGQADEVMALGEHLFRKGNEQLGMAHDDGLTGIALADCMKVAFAAAAQSPRPVPERLLWEIEIRLADEYSILDGGDGLVAKGRGAKADWRAVADTLTQRLAAIPLPTKDAAHGGFHEKYHREAVMHWLIRALERAGRPADVIPLLEREAPVTQCYVALVDALLATKRVADAERWAREGFARTVVGAPGIAWMMVERLLAIAQAQADKPLVAAYRAVLFRDRPELSRYRELAKAAEAAGVWPTVRAAVLCSLETGRAPDTDPGGWPLPSTGLPFPPERPGARQAPHLDVLIDVALHEKRHDDAIRWQAAAEKRGGAWGGHSADKVAEAVQGTHPDAALSLWQDLVAGMTVHANPRAYLEAGVVLAKVKALCERERRLAEWQRYVARLYEENRRRPRMKDVLDRLERRRTPIVGEDRPGVA